MPNHRANSDAALRRGATRAPVDFEARLEPAEGVGSNHAARVVDLSLTGCLLELPFAPTVGSLWTLFIPGGRNATQPAFALVRRLAAVTPSLWRVGCQFIADPALWKPTSPPLTAGREAPATGPDWQLDFDLTAPQSLALDTARALSLRVTRDLMVAKSMSDVVADVGGHLLAANAHVTGGRLHVLGRILVGTLGSPDSRSTLVTLGRQLGASLLLASLPAAIAELEAAATAKDATFQQLQSRPSNSLSPADREMVTVLMSEIDEMNQRLRRMSTNADRLRSRDMAPGTLRLEVAQRLHAGVTICHADKALTFRTTLEGPLTFTVAPGGTLLVQVGANPPRPAAELADAPPAQAA